MVVMGHIGAPFGVKGSVKVSPCTETQEALLDYPIWWLGNEEQGGWHEVKVAEAALHGKGLIARFDGCHDRDAAARYRGKQIALRRADLPESAAGEFYWVDLVGLAVVNLEGTNLGAVAALVDTGANLVLEVKGDRERLIPFVDPVVREVDLEAGRIRVDWGADY